MNHRTFGSPQLRPVLKNSCTSPPDQCSKFLVVHLLLLQKVFGKKKSHFNIKLSSQLQDAWIQIWLNLLRHKMQRLWVVEKVSRALQKMWEDKVWQNSWLVVAGSGDEQQAEKPLCTQSHCRKICKKTSGSGRDISTNIPHWSCRAIFVTKFL